MIIVRMIHGKRTVFETEPGGNIITKDGKPVNQRGHEIKDLQQKHQHEMNSFMQKQHDKSLR